MYALVRRSESLDVNSPYSYLLLATHFAGTSVVAVHDHRVVGFVSAYLKPAEPAVLFVWQVAVDRSVQGQGVARRMLLDILDRPGCAAVRYLEATVTPDNDASWALFKSLARARRTEWTRRPCFAPDHFGDEAHAPEDLIRVGPFTQEPKLKE